MQSLLDHLHASKYKFVLALVGKLTQHDNKFEVDARGFRCGDAVETVVERVALKLGQGSQLLALLLETYIIGRSCVSSWVPDKAPAIQACTP